MRARALLGRAFRAGALLEARFLGARDFFAGPLFFAVFARAGRLAVFFDALARAGRLVVFFDAFARARRLAVFFDAFARSAALARAGRFFFAVLVRGAALARVARFVVVLRGPVFLAVARRGLVPVDRFAPPALARVAPFLAGARRAPDFLVLLFRTGGLRRRMEAGASSSSYTGGGVPAYSGSNSSAPKVRRPARHAAMMTAPNP